jgi:hypothetical protein
MDRPALDFRSLSKRQSIFNVDAEISDRVLDLRMTQQDLDRARLPVAL